MTHPGRDFKETVKARIVREPAFRGALLAEVVDSLIAGEIDVGAAMLRDFFDTGAIPRLGDNILP